MENLNVIANGDNQVNREKPPPRVCPRCKSDDTKFGYYNNYSVSQPRYFCRSCRRHWTHGGALRDIPVGGSTRRPMRARIVAPVARVDSVDIQQVNQQPQLPNVQENNVFVGNHLISPLSDGYVGGYVGISNGYHMNQADQYLWNQSFNNTTSVDHNASTSGSGGSDMNNDTDNFMNNDTDNFINNDTDNFMNNDTDNFINNSD